MSIAKTTIILDTRKVKNDNTYPIKLRVTFERKQQYYPTPHSLTSEDFERVMFSKKLNEADKKLKLQISAFENKAVDIVKDLPFFSWHSFEKNYLSNRGAKDSVDSAFTERSTQLRSAGQIGTAVNYECAQKSLNTFREGLKFADITPAFLRQYEQWMLLKGRSVTTISMYLRCLRTILNNAIDEGLITKEYYPFGKRRYEIPTSTNTKKALSMKDLSSIYNYKAEPGSMTERAKEYWLFMYYGNGINVKDMCLLRYENIKDGNIVFERAKTARTKRNVEAIRILFIDQLKTIVQKWGNERKSDKTFIFPVLEDGLTPERQRQLIQQLTGVINDHMKAIAKALKINSDCTTYAARHSFATVLQRSGAPTQFITQALGHSNVRTTQNYLAGFEDDSRKEVLRALTAFHSMETNENPA